MASVFLSYDREDAAKARALAHALERSGHKVWWDRHIKSGAQYSKEIEEALNAADAIVVLWSERSVESAWVRDEAAVGRDSGRLVPAKFGKIEPPLGFRQYQTTDLSRWKGRAVSEEFQGMLDVIGGMSGKPGTERPSTARDRMPTYRRSPFPFAAVAIAVLIAVLLLIWRPWAGRAEAPVVTVMAASNSPAAQGLASDLFVKLGSLQASRADSLQLVEPGSAMEVDYAFKVGGAPGEAKANLVLTGPKGTLLWSREFEQPDGNQSDLRQQIAYSVGHVLRCATEALAPDHPRLEQVTLRQYLNACAELSDLLSQDASIVIPTLRQITEQAPRFAGGWGKLILAEMIAYRRTDAADAELRRDLRADIDKARKLHPDIAEPSLAEAWLQEPRPISAWMRFTEEAVAKDPNHADALINRATGLIHLGRMKDAVEDARRAARAEPLYPAARESLIDVLMTAGQIDAARKELHEAERLWPNASNLVNLRYSLAYRYGDPGEAMEIRRSGKLGFTPSAHQASFLEARLDPSPARIEKAISDARNAYRSGEPGGFSDYVQALAFFGRHDDARQELLAVDPKSQPGIIWTLFRRYFSDLRRDPRFMAIMKRFEVIPYWEETGKWPDFCNDPDLPYDCRAEARRLGAK